MKCDRKIGFIAMLVMTGVVIFQLAATIQYCRGLVVIPLAISFFLASNLQPRKSFSVGFVYGFLIFAPQLYWFYTLFEYFAFILWSVFGLWIALWFYSVSVIYSMKRLTLNRRVLLGCFLSAILWFGMEFLRSEYFYLRFSWLTTGYITGPHPMNPIVGVYGWSFLLMFLSALAIKCKPKILLPVLTVLAVGLLGPWINATTVEKPHDDSPLIIGIQYEFEDERVIKRGLELAIEQYPEVDLIVLSEYAFNTPPSWMNQWCADNEVHVLAGAATRIQSSTNYFNTAIVWGPSGEVVFSQSKSQPVQFVENCTPAEEQTVWQSPWGNIGVAICFDSSYRRVMDSLITQGSELIIIIAMDPVQWGLYEHELDARVCPIRSSEYGVPFIRVCSSGISQSIQSGGLEVSTVPMPGQGEMLVSTLGMGQGSVPMDIYVAFPSALFFIFTVLIGLSQTLVSLICRLFY